VLKSTLCIWDESPPCGPAVSCPFPAPRKIGKLLGSPGEKAKTLWYAHHSLRLEITTANSNYCKEEECW